MLDFGRWIVEVAVRPIALKFMRRLYERKTEKQGQGQRSGI